MKPQFLIERNGKQFALYAGLLDEAHEQGLKAITTTLIQIPNELNGYVAICHAVVETSKGAFTGLGDAAQDNVSRMMLPHLIRMAETRAKARALRDAVNVGVASAEELGPDGGTPDDDHGFPEPIERDTRRMAPERPHAVETARDYRALEPRDVESSAAGNRPGAAPATPKQLQTIQRMSRASGEQIDTNNLTRAQASEIISRLIGEMDQRSAQ